MEQGWEGDRNYQLGNKVADLTSTATSKAEEILQNGRKWDAELDSRDKVRETYTDDEIEEATSWISQQKKEQNELTTRAVFFNDDFSPNSVIWLLKKLPNSVILTIWEILLLDFSNLTFEKLQNSILLTICK